MLAAFAFFTLRFMPLLPLVFAADTLRYYLPYAAMLLLALLATSAVTPRHQHMLITSTLITTLMMPCYAIRWLLLSPCQSCLRAYFDYYFSFHCRHYA